MSWEGGKRMRVVSWEGRKGGRIVRSQGRKGGRVRWQDRKGWRVVRWQGGRFLVLIQGWRDAGWVLDFIYLFLMLIKVFIAPAKIAGREESI